MTLHMNATTTTAVLLRSCWVTQLVDGKCVRIENIADFVKNSGIKYIASNLSM